MAKRQGGIAKKGHRGKDDTEVYIHPYNAKEIVEYLAPHYTAYSSRTLDACSGYKVLGQAFEEHASVMKYATAITYVDNKDYGFDDVVITDVLNFRPKHKFDYIWCNPPWTPVERAQAIYHHLRSLLDHGGVLFFIINNIFVYQGWERGVDLAVHKYYFLPRFAFQASGKPLTDPGVIVHHEGSISELATKLNSFIKLTKYPLGNLKTLPSKATKHEFPI